MQSTLILENSDVLQSSESLPARRSIRIRGGFVEQVEESGTTTEAGDAQRIDCSEYYVMPGLVNAHTHSHNTLFKGYGDGWNLELLLAHGPALNTRRTPEDHYWAAMLNGVEQLRSGVTEAYDLVIHSPAPTVESIEAVTRAYRDLGMRAIVAPAFSDRPLHAIIPGLLDSLPAPLRREVESLLPEPAESILANLSRAFQSIDQDDYVQLAVAPTIPAQCTDRLLQESKRLADDYETGLHTHLAESHTQAVEGLRRFGTSLTKHLARLDLLSEHFVGAHGVWLDDDDLHILASAGATIVHNPASNLRLASGVAPIRSYLDAGVNVAVGSDGSASSDNPSRFEAMRLTSHLSRLWSPAPGAWLHSGDVLDATICGGAQACGHLRPSAPDIRAGMPADLVLLRKDSLHLTPLTNLPSQIVSSETGAGVDSVMVGGKFVLRHGEATRVSLDKAKEHCQMAADRLLQSNSAEFELARRMSPYVVQVCRELAGYPPLLDRGLVASR
jgi:5-methylthioadenosine/S-adenosylhomocysteine deaminase